MGLPEKHRYNIGLTLLLTEGGGIPCLPRAAQQPPQRLNNLFVGWSLEIVLTAAGFTSYINELIFAAAL